MTPAKPGSQLIGTIVGILDDLDREKQELLNNQFSRPDPWANSEDKLEEWIGILPPGAMKERKRRLKHTKQPPREQVSTAQTPNRMIIDIILVSSVGDIILPTDFNNQVEYARVLKVQSSKVKDGYYPGYKIEVSIGKLMHRRRIFDPVRTIEEARKSPEFILAMSKAIKAISDHKS